MLELFVGVISVATSDSMASLSLDILAAGQMATESELKCLLADRHPRIIATVRNFKKHREDAGRSLVCHAAHEHPLENLEVISLRSRYIASLDYSMFVTTRDRRSCAPCQMKAPPKVSSLGLALPCFMLRRHC